jgi:hypothetical protein
MSVPQKVSHRIAAGLKRFQPILAAALARDVNESDTVVIVADILQEIFGYDKYTEITSEHAIRGTFCDLAVKGPDGKPQLIIEVKAIGVELKDAHVKQAVDYAANQGTDWVCLTNGTVWRIYKVTFTKPIDQELVLELDLQKVNPRGEDDIDRTWLLSKEGSQRGGLGDYHTQRRALSRFFLGAVVLSEPVLEVVRRELRRISPGVKIAVEEIESVLRAEVIKREVIEGEKADEARRHFGRVHNRALRSKSERLPHADAPGASADQPADAVTEEDASPSE